MSKAILVIDMPDNCLECSLSQGIIAENTLGYYKDYKCPFGCSEHGSFIKRPSDCPLKSVPEKREYYYGISEAWAAWVDGWNDCLEEIIGR